MLTQGRNTNFLSPFDRGFARLFDELFSNSFSLDWNDIPEVQFKCSSQKFPLTNAVLDKETKNISLSIALAGYDKEDLKVRIEGNHVVVSSEKKEKEFEKTKKFLWKDVTQKSFEVSYQFPDGKYSLEEIEVDFTNGMLNIIIPAKESEKPKEISIK